MARSPHDRARGDALPRLLWACLLAPPALLAVYAGSPWHEAAVAGAALLMAREWARLCGAGAVSGWALAAGALAAGLAAGLGAPAAAAAAVAATAAALLLAHRGGLPGDAAVAAAGGAAIASFAAALVWLRFGPADGRALVFGLLCVVWSTDVGAYVLGRAVGGPRLAPRVSPGKTWAGLAGGCLCAAAAGLLWARAAGVGEPAWALAAAVALALAAQAGDLAVSAAKRRHGVKDAGSLIPGHGGVLDRADGMLLAGPVAALMAAAAGGG